MKKITIIILSILLVLSITSNGQDIPSEGSYKINNTMGGFHGTWIWTNGNDTVKIYLMTQQVHYDINGGFFCDRIIGWHLYKRGNQIIENSYNYAGTPFSSGHSTILGGNELNPNVLTCQLRDILKYKDYEGTLTLNPAHNKITWHSFEHSGMRVYTDQQDVPPAGLTLPTDMIFIKQ